jgi:hypothetical protein
MRSPVWQCPETLLEVGVEVSDRALMPAELDERVGAGM